MITTRHVFPVKSREVSLMVPPTVPLPNVTQPLVTPPTLLSLKLDVLATAPPTHVVTTSLCW